MRSITIPITLVLLSVLFLSSVRTQEAARYRFKDSEVPITSVTVYTGKAEVTRKIEKNLSPGLNELVFELPYSVPSNSIRISNAVGKATIIDLTTELIIEELPTDPALQANKKIIEGLKKELKKIDLELATLKGDKAWLKGYSDLLLRDANLKELGKHGTVSEFITFYHQKTVEISSQISDVEEKQIETVKKIEQLSSQLPSPYKMNREYQLVSVVLEASEETKVSFGLSYTTEQASWSSSYDVRVDSEDKNVDVNYFGNIINFSGEDWKDVSLVLSTAMTGLNGAPPQLNTLLVQRKQTRYESYGSTRIGKFSQTNMDYADLLIIEDEELPSMKSPGTVINEGLTATTYTIMRKYSIESDRKPHKVVVMNSKSKSTFTYEAIPKFQTEAFLKASILNENPGIYLPGPMNIYLDGNFVAKNEMKSVNPGENFTIFLGTDSGVKVEYKNFGDYKDKSGVFTKSNYLTSKSKIVIKNFKKQPISIAIYDQLPKSIEEEIQVILHEPNPLTFTPDDGGVRLTEANNVRWFKTIPPKGREEMRLEYSVEYPMDLEIEKA